MPTSFRYTEEEVYDNVPKVQSTDTSNEGVCGEGPLRGEEGYVTGHSSCCVYVTCCLRYAEAGAQLESDAARFALYVQALLSLNALTNTLVTALNLSSTTRL